MVMGDIKSVIYSIYGKDVATGIMPVDYIYEDIQISGVIGKPEIARSNRANQLFFVNKRYIKDKALSAATEQAYKGLIPIGKFGFVILNITMNPSKVDVNVHPAKLEVRFEEESKVFQSIYHAIKDTLLKGELVANTEKQEETETNESKGLFDFRKNETEKIEKYNDEESKIKTNVPNDTNSLNVGQGGPVNTADVLEQLKKMQEDLNKEKQNDINVREKVQEVTQEPVEEAVQEITQEPANESNKEETQETPQETIQEPAKEEIQESVPQDFNSMYEKLFGTKPIMDTTEVTEEKVESKPIDLIKDNLSVFEENEEYKRPIYKFIGIVFNTYIIIEMDKEMYIIDQHAAHERIMYEKVKKNYYSETSKDSQMLLLPDIITLSHKEMEIAKDNMEMFEKVGFCLEEFGENTIKLTGVPTICIDIDNKELFLETLDEINTVARTAKQEKEEKFIATVACKAAVKANMVLDKAEVESLMDKLLELPNPFTCPHGRPTAIKMSKYDIERKFARK